MYLVTELFSLNEIKMGKPKWSKSKITHPTKRKEKTRVRRMSFKEKIQISCIVLSLIAACVGGAELSVMKVVSHEHARLEGIDLKAMTLSVIMEGESDPITVYWNENTEFAIEETKVTPFDLKPLMDIIVWKKESLIFPDKIIKISASPLPLKPQQ